MNKVLFILLLLILLLILYHKGRNTKDFNNQPVSRALSMGVHESQSLFWERNIFQSREFWDFLTPLIHKHFPHTIGVNSEEFYLYCNQVTPGFIRVDADEVTYPLHIILRFELFKFRYIRKYARVFFHTFIYYHSFYIIWYFIKRINHFFFIGN